MITKDGTQFSFCPAKATWEPSTSMVFNSLVISVETGALWQDGGISDQPEWFIELLSLFVVRYNENKFWSRARAILGDSSKAPASKNQLPQAASRKGAR